MNKNNKGLATLTIVLIIVAVVVVTGGTIGGVVAYNSYQDKKQQEAEIASLKAIEDARNNAVNSYNDRINQIMSSLNVEKDSASSLDNNEDIDAMNNAVNELNSITNDINNNALITQEQKGALNGTVSGCISTVENRINTVNEARAEAERQAKAIAEAEAQNNKRMQGYTNEELCDMARNYYMKKHNGSSPPIIEVDQDKGDKVVIHLYEVVRDGPRSGHTATYGWYEVDRHTGKGQDMTTYVEVDLTQ